MPLSPDVSAVGRSNVAFLEPENIGRLGSYLRLHYENRGDTKVEELQYASRIARTLGETGVRPGERVLQGAETGKRRGEAAAACPPPRLVVSRQRVESRVRAGAGGQTGCPFLQTTGRAGIGPHDTLIQLFYYRPESLFGRGGRRWMVQ